MLLCKYSIKFATVHTYLTTENAKTIIFFPVQNILPSVQNLQCDADKVYNKTILPFNLRTVAAKKGFLVSDNQASGNCLFYALSEQLKSVKGIQISCKGLRNTLVQFLRENTDRVRR